MSLCWRCFEFIDFVPRCKFLVSLVFGVLKHSFGNVQVYCTGMEC